MITGTVSAAPLAAFAAVALTPTARSFGAVEDFVEGKFGRRRIDDRDHALVVLGACHFAQALRIGDGDRTSRRFRAGDDVAQPRALAGFGDEERAHRFRPLAQTRDDGVKAVEGSG